MEASSPAGLRTIRILWSTIELSGQKEGFRDPLSDFWIRTPPRGVHTSFVRLKSEKGRGGKHDRCLSVYLSICICTHYKWSCNCPPTQSAGGIAVSCESSQSANPVISRWRTYRAAFERRRGRWCGLRALPAPVLSTARGLPDASQTAAAIPAGSSRSSIPASGPVAQD